MHLNDQTVRLVDGRLEVQGKIVYLVAQRSLDMTRQLKEIAVPIAEFSMTPEVRRTPYHGWTLSPVP